MGTKLVLFGSDLTQAKTVDAIITATEAKSGKTIDLFFKITALNCTPAGPAATPSTVTLLEDTTSSVVMSQTNPTQCGSYTYALTTPPSFVTINGSTITVSPTVANSTI